MWSWFGRGKQSKNLTIAQSGDKFVKVKVKDIDFFGPFSESSNRRYLVAWSDFDSSSGRGGFREGGLGTYILAEYGTVVAIGNAERPNDGKVADNGAFIFNDWMFGEGLKGTFLAFDRNGNNILRHGFSANLLNNGISCNGEYAVCQLCNSDTEDGSILAFFDLRDGKLLWKKIPETGWAHEYTFDIEKRLLTLTYRDTGQFTYSFDGAFLDQAKWEKVSFERATGFELHLRAKEKLTLAKRTGAKSDFLSILELLGIALRRGVDQYPNEQAAIYRTMGEIKEMLGESSEALALYERALSLNPKVGLKRKVAAMKAGHA
ncbi:MAG: hypothetical protein KGL31_12675 [candidate division NC10 bacterium]|nr:hypothetical protein [candidate division NC10 bacterium]